MFLVVIILDLLVASVHSRVDCRIPNNWKYELTLTAANDDSSQPAMTTDGYSVIDGAYVTAKCQLYTWTFMNKYRGLANTDAKTKEALPTAGDYLDKKDGNIKVGCKAGVFSPDIFTSETSWCARGCQGLDPTFLSEGNKQVIYPRGSRTLNSFKAPVQRNTSNYINLECARGYAVTNDTVTRPKKTLCALTGYEPTLAKENYQECIAGCPDPKPEIPFIKLSGRSAKANSRGVFEKGSIVTLACNSSGRVMFGTGYRQCRPMRGQFGNYLSVWDPPTTVTRCLPRGSFLKSSSSQPALNWWMLIVVYIMGLFLII